MESSAGIFQGSLRNPELRPQGASSCIQSRAESIVPGCKQAPAPGLKLCRAVLRAASLCEPQTWPIAKKRRLHNVGVLVSSGDSILFSGGPWSQRPQGPAMGPQPPTQHKTPPPPSTAPYRLDSEDDREPGKVQHLHTKPDSSPPVEGHDSEVWNVSEELFLSKVKPKEGCQMEEEADNSEAEKRPKGKETKEPERDVYTFPGDSDPESPPPAPWAQCTFIQRCRKKRVLLRPFSGLGTLKRTLPETDSPGESNPTELNQAGGVLDFEEAAEEEPKEEKGCKDIFTCVECSIYFKKQVHLQEHIVEHCESGAGEGRRLGKGGRFRCTECGWNLANRLALSDHHRRHQESRLKILGRLRN
ncbi:hypothetical protein F7725_003899 [Dissostichus mawsoni]|uniref:C2H2-type domain-containing protein n=1 Tax=Dissostichus mawsoni TaxID=36200 RepID=A0A7J5YCU9_DISMA|nr:hypothetical protein F7725_003899 [Dissostichus mawsoni]